MVKLIRLTVLEDKKILIEKSHNEEGHIVGTFPHIRCNGENDCTDIACEVGLLRMTLDDARAYLERSYPGIEVVTSDYRKTGQFA